MRVIQIGADARWWGDRAPTLRRFGVPIGGPFDRQSWSVARMLVGAPGAVEIGPFGGIFVAESRLTLGLAGAVRPVLVDGIEIPDQGRFHLEPGQRLELGLPLVGARSYLALYGSVEDGAVKRGDTIAGAASTLGALKLTQPPSSVTDSDPLATMPGPQASLFHQNLKEYTVSADADRIGIRLEGDSLLNHSAATMPSEPQTVGTIQVPPNGKPIIIGPDGPTIGGYPKIAVVVSADWDRLGQLKPGDSVTFRTVDQAEADSLRREARRRFLKETVWRLRAD